jgi:hypothetical protein
MKYPNPSARSQIRQGIHQEIKSKIAVVFRLPSLSVITPLRKANTTWENIYTEATMPISTSFIPRAIIYTEA